MVRRLIVFIAAVSVTAVFAVPAAQAEFGIAKWTSVTCKTNEDTPAPGPVPVGPAAPPLPQAPGQCTGESSSASKWFKQAAGHPPFGITDFTLNTFPAASGAEGFPEGFVKDIVVETPPGLSVNPEALPQCPVAQKANPSCPRRNTRSANYFTVATEAPPCAPCKQARFAVPVYNLVPFNEVPSMVGFMTASGPTFIVGSLDPVDQHVTFTISDIHAPPAGPPVVGSRLVFNGVAGNGTYLTMPSNCASASATLKVDQADRTRHLCVEILHHSIRR